MAWTAYAIAPIDFRWELLPTVEKVAAQFARETAKEVVDGHDTHSFELTKFLSDFQEARLLAKQKGWEGDYRIGEGPRVFWLPGDDSFVYAFVWKQENNGDTFVVSPRLLGWLNDRE